MNTAAVLAGRLGVSGRRQGRGFGGDMTVRHQVVVFDYTVDDLELFDELAKRPKPRRVAPRRRRVKKAPAKKMAPKPEPPRCFVIQLGSGGSFGGEGLVRSKVAARRYSSSAEAWRAFDAWVAVEYPGESRPESARLLERRVG